MNNPKKPISSSLSQGGIFLFLLTAFIFNFAPEAEAWVVLKPKCYRGEAAVVKGTVHGKEILISSVGPLPGVGGALEKTLANIQIAGVLDLQLAEATTEGANEAAVSESSVLKLRLAIGLNLITADVVRSMAIAECTTNGILLGADTTLLNLRVNNSSVTAAGATNAELPLICGKIIINEQCSSRGDLCGDIKVNGLHIIIPGVADLVVSYASAGLTCEWVPEEEIEEKPEHCPPPPAGSTNCLDPSNGRGWFCPEGVGKLKKSYTLSVRPDRSGALKGRLLFVDKATGLKVKCTKVLGQYTVSSKTRVIDYEGTLANEPVLARVVVSDHGRPGLNDTFELILSNGYRIAGDLGATTLGRGDNRLWSR